MGDVLNLDDARAPLSVRWTGHAVVVTYRDDTGPHELWLTRQQARTARIVLGMGAAMQDGLAKALETIGV